MGNSKDCNCNLKIHVKGVFTGSDSPAPYEYSGYVIKYNNNVLIPVAILDAPFIMLSNQFSPFWSLTDGVGNIIATSSYSSSFCFPEVINFNDFALNPDSDHYIFEFSAEVICAESCITDVLFTALPNSFTNTLGDLIVGVKNETILTQAVLGLNQLFSATIYIPDLGEVVHKKIRVAKYIFTDQAGSLISFTPSPAFPYFVGYHFVNDSFQYIQDLQNNPQSQNLYYLCYEDSISPQVIYSKEQEQFIYETVCLQCKLADEMYQYTLSSNFGIECPKSLNELRHLRLGLQVLNTFNVSSIGDNSLNTNTLSLEELKNLKSKLHL